MNKKRGISIEQAAEIRAQRGYPSPTMHAKSLYWKGYRKQSEGEWIEEKHDNGRKSARRRLVVYATYIALLVFASFSK